ncbi:MAG: DUF134 domain-containing protein [Candidatus Omnitrophica bacterium]|nr:DUF134 domain-containing protein [Candidatus Omnitrophota bacterium]
MRPKKKRWIECVPGQRCFRPCCKKGKRLEGVILTLDEYEALRLADLKGMHQVDAARRLKVSRPTFSRIVESGRKKIADAIVNIKAIKVEGGSCCVNGKAIR